jgi:hypothetical protein
MKYRTIQGLIGLNFCHVDYYGLFDSPATIKSTIFRLFFQNHCSQCCFLRLLYSCIMRVDTILEKEVSWGCPNKLASMCSTFIS